MNKDIGLFLRKHKQLLAIIALLGLIVILWFKQYVPKTNNLIGVTTQVRDTALESSSGRGGGESATAPEFDEDTSSPSSRLVIKTASLVMRVDSVTDSSNHIQLLADQLGGFVISSRTNTLGTGTTAEYLQSVVTIRVPAEQFEDALTEIKQLARKVENETVTGQDVTEEYTDLQAEITNLEAAEAQLVELFNRAGSVEEILKVQQEITRIRGQIEVKKGRVQYLEQSAQLSSITVTLTEKKDDPIIADADWTPMTAIRNAARDFVTFGQNLVDATLYLSIRYGLFVILAIIAYRAYRRRQK